MRILHIIPDYFGTNLYSTFISNLNEHGVENVIYIPHKEHNISYLSKDIIISNKSYNLLEKFLFFGKQFNSIIDIKKRIDLSSVSMIHAHNMFSGGYVALKLSQEFKIPYIVAVRNTDVNVFYKYMIHLRCMGNKIFHNASKVIFLSPSYKKLILKKYFKNQNEHYLKSKTIVLPNGINSYFLTNQSNPKEIKKENSINLIYIGEIVKNKNIDLTIKACYLLINQGYKINFRIIGESKDNALLAKICKNQFVDYYPKTTKEGILSHLRNSDIFVMVSKTETFGLVYPEAMSQGIPIIYSSGQGIDGFFRQGEVGYSVSNKNHKSLANAIVKILNNYYQISVRCTDRAKQFNWKQITYEYIKLYEKK